MPPKISAGRGWGKSSASLHSCPGTGGSPSLGVIQSCGDVALRDVGSGYGGVRLEILEVFSHRSDSVIL